MSEKTTPKKYIIFMAHKGGVGKSTMSKQFSRELHRLGKVIEGQDYDPQQHFARFMEVNSYLFTKQEEAEYVVVDTQGAHTQTNIDIMQGMQHEDALFVVLFRPTEDDYKETLVIRDRLKAQGVLDKALFVVNGCYRENDKDVKEFKERLRDTVKVAQSVFVQRKNYAKEPDSKVRGEISRFLHEAVL
ncbi:TPA: ParA family protein [Vibrio harveyi]|uniref:ParA family protein n=1 Tax=Vibrio harveyi TaxID=669 RepID=UPI0006832275|nr:ParA family protein [Vibrio harveyi]